MLQTLPDQSAVYDVEQTQALSPAFLLEAAKRRLLFFVIPFVIVLAIGTVVTFAWPARYLSEGKILISSQEIPKDLVKPTVNSLANERIQIIEQRVMTRDNLLGIAKKFQIANNSWQGVLLSGTEIIDFIRSRAQIKPLELSLGGGNDRRAIAFTVGFEYENPVIAAKVANELVTMILAEDVRSRTAFASETTKFLDRDVQRLEAQLSQLDTQIAELRRRPGAVIDISKFDEGKTLAALKAELVLQSANYSSSHPAIRALKRKIEALEKGGVTDADASPAASTEMASAAAEPAGIDSLETKRKSLREELTGASQKLAAARLGENLERGQHSERLEVLEQPTVPTKPTSPKRGKLMLVVCMAALMAGGGLAFAAEMMDQSVRRSSDLFSMIDSHLVVSIPYITTTAELRGKKRKIIIASVAVVALIIAAVITIVFILPPLDIVFDKLMKALVR